jgi:hypothetical protein
MDQMQITKQILEFNKVLFDNTFKSMTFLHDQTEQYVFRFLEKATWVPTDGKKAVNEWVNTYKKGIEYFKVYADDNYKKVVDFFANAPTKEAYKDRK